MEEAKLKHGLKPELPDFYNIILERPREDARGYGLLYVDVRCSCSLVHIFLFRFLFISSPFVFFCVCFTEIEYSRDFFMDYIGLSV